MPGAEALAENVHVTHYEALDVDPDSLVAVPIGATGSEAGDRHEAPDRQAAPLGRSTATSCRDHRRRDRRQQVEDQQQADQDEAEPAMRSEPTASPRTSAPQAMANAGTMNVTVLAAVAVVWARTRRRWATRRRSR